MHIDSHSLAELQIVEPIGVSSVLTLFDRTTTAGGRARLVAMLTTPLTSADAIRRRQATLRALAPLDEATDLTTLTPVRNATIAYLDSRWQELPRSRAACWASRFSHADQYRDVTRGLRALINVIDTARRLRDLLASAPDECEEIEHIRACARACVDDPVLAQLAERGRHTRTMPAAAACLDASIRTRGPTLDRVRAWLDALDLLDALRSMARAPAGFEYPRLLDDRAPRLAVTGLFHPLVADPVTADVVWAPGHRVFFITGPNMAGKTTLMRAVALVVHLTHVGMAVPGHAERTLFDRLFVAVSVRDSIQRGESFFLAEVRRIGVLTDALQRGDRTFAVVDEAFKGTNVSDARDATLLLVHGLGGCAHALSIVASHLTEAADTLVDDPRIRLLQMSATLDGERWRFDYRLEPGISRTRLGLALLDREGVGTTLRVLARGTSTRS